MIRFHGSPLLARRGGCAEGADGVVDQDSTEKVKPAGFSYLDFCWGKID